MAEGPPQRVSVYSTNDRASRIELLRSRIPLGEMIEFPPAMTLAQLQQIPKATITKEQADLLFQCAVCFHEFKSNEDEVRKLPCNHMYHDKCIFPWLRNNPSCPTCRAPIPHQEDDDFVDIIQRKAKTFKMSSILFVFIRSSFRTFQLSYERFDTFHRRKSSANNFTESASQWPSSLTLARNTSSNSS